MINSNRDESSPYANLCESHYDEILISSITMTSRIHFHRTTSVPELEWVVDLLCLVVIEIDRRSIFRRFVSRTTRCTIQAERGTRMLSTSTDELLLRRGRRS